MTSVLTRSLNLRASLGIVLLVVCSVANAADVTTYHNDSHRSGWNSRETILNTASVASADFGRLNIVTLPGTAESESGDEQIDAQPLLISATTFAAMGLSSTFPHDVVYVATSRNNIYAIDAFNGNVLLKKNFGVAVDISNLPGSCSNNHKTVGITSTPVIDLQKAVMYAVAYSWENGAAVYRVHQIDIRTLADLISPAPVISANGVLSDGSLTAFQAGSQRQRAALLLNNGNLYAAFASFCDFNSNIARGWILGWATGATTGSLTPFATAGLADQQTAKEAGPGQFNATRTRIQFLSSIWMSGYGPAADTENNVYFLTGNSNGKTTHNFPESALKVSSDLSSVKSYFTRSAYAILDRLDSDFGSGGIMVVGSQAVGAGKDGVMFLFKTSSMTVSAAVNIGDCWCGPSYFVGSDGKPRIVSSGGRSVKTWLLADGSLTEEATSPSLTETTQDPGFFTSVSSKANNANTGIIWTISRPDADSNVYLHAFNATAASGALVQLGASPYLAGTWTSPNNNASLVPTVANGRVYVASYNTVYIFGLGSRLTVTNSNSSGGTVSSNINGLSCGSICGALYEPGISVTLTASPASGHQFLGWSGVCQGNDLTCTVTMSESRTVSASFN